MQLYAVKFIPLLGSLYMFRVFYTSIIRNTVFNLSTATGTNHSIVSATYPQRGLQALLHCVYSVHNFTSSPKRCPL